MRKRNLNWGIAQDTLDLGVFVGVILIVNWYGRIQTTVGHGIP